MRCDASWSLFCHPAMLTSSMLKRAKAGGSDGKKGRQKQADGKQGGQKNDVAKGDRSAHGKDARLAQLIAQQGQAKEGNRTKASRKPVFRPILASPFACNWPAIKSADGPAILHTLLAFLAGVNVKSILQRTNADLPRASARKTKDKNQKRKLRLLLGVLHRQGIQPKIADVEPSSAKEQAAGPGNANEGGQDHRKASFLCGLNSVTRHLERLISDKVHGSATERDESQHEHTPTMVFVCQADVSPPDLVSHIPLLVATYNALCDGHARLIRLPAKSEEPLSDAVNLRRCSVLSIDTASLQKDREGNDNTTDLVSPLEAILKQSNVAEMRLAWLDDAAKVLAKTSLATASPSALQGEIDLLPPRIKHVRTSMPADMNAVRAAKKAQRAERKEKRKSFQDAKKRAQKSQKAK